MATLDHISGAEPSTVTFKVRTVRYNQNSSNMHAEVLVVGDPDTTNALAAVLAAAPASTAWGLVVRPVGTLPTSGDSTVLQGTNPWIVSPAAGSTWSVRPVQSSQADLRTTVYQSTASDLQATVGQASTVWAVQLTQYSTIVSVSTGSVRVHQSTAADLNVTVAGYSTVVAVSSLGGAVIVRSSAANALVSVYQSTASELQATVTPVAGSTWATRPIQSSAADLQVTATQSAAVWTVNIGTHIQSSVAPSSNSSGIIVRQVVSGINTTASTSAFAASTSLSIASSVASRRAYVTAYSITTTNAGPTKIGFFSSNTLLWPIVLAAVSSAVSGVNLAVTAPSYLFKTTVSEALSLRTKSSTIAGWSVGVSYYQAP